MARAGLIAWAIGSLFFLYGFMLRVSPSVMVDELMREFQVSALVLGNLSAIYFYVYAAVQIPIGIMMDRIGPRVLMSVASLLCALGCVLFASAESIWLAYVGRFFIGLGSAFSWVGVLTIIATSLPARNFAGFTGGGQLAGTSGAILGQAPLALVIEMAGWRFGLYGLGLLGVLLATGLWLTVQPVRRDAVSSVPLRQSFRTAASNPQTWLFALIGMSLTGPVLAFAGLWGVPWFAAVKDMPRSEAAPLLSTVFVGWLIGAPLMGWLSDKLQRRVLLLVCGTLISTLTIVGVLYVPDLSVRTIAALLFVGGIGGSVMILTFAAGRDHNPEYARGAALGIINTCVVASGALLQPLIGALLDLFWDGTVQNGIRVYSAQAYQQAMLCIPVGALAGFLLTFFVSDARD
jgi:MFS family permease